MKNLLIGSMLLVSTLSFADCPSATLIKKSGLRTHYSTDLKTTYRQADLEKFGCKLNFSIMSSDQRRQLLDQEYNTKKAQL